MRELGVIRAVTLTLALSFLSASFLHPQENPPAPEKKPKDQQEPKKEQDPPKPAPRKKQDKKWEDF